MNTKFFLTLSACSLFVLTSCSKMGALSADNFTVTPNPLETQGGQVGATINGLFPEKFMKRNATVTVIPELRSAGGQVMQGEPATFQGERVMGNNQMISYRLGGRYTMKASFPYTDEFQQSTMYLTFNAHQGKKQVQLPAVKVAEGVVATSELYRKALLADGAIIAPDSFQRVQAQRQEANVKFLINQAELRKSELRNNSVQEFVSLLQRINADRGKTMSMKNVQIQAYASPEGGVSFNDRLANKRQDVSEGYVKQQLKQSKIDTEIDASYTAQDWEGFQRLVQASNIQDKDVILRVLSMYKDPQEREQQIRNMSEGFQELASGILPELRRSRLTINYEIVGRSDEEIQRQYEENPVVLSPDELLYAATLETNPARQEEIYKTAARCYDKDYRAYNNLAVLAFNRGNYDEAKRYLQQAHQASPKAAEAFANEGLLALKDGDVKTAEGLIAQAADANSLDQAAGLLNLAKGNYAQAEANFNGRNTNCAALAQIMNKNYAAAMETLDKVPVNSAMTSYLHAIIAARRGNKYAAQSYLKEALEKDPSLQTYADKDLELSFLK